MVRTEKESRDTNVCSFLFLQPPFQTSSGRTCSNILNKLIAEGQGRLAVAFLNDLLLFLHSPEQTQRDKSNNKNHRGVSLGSKPPIQWEKSGRYSEDMQALQVHGSGAFQLRKKGASAGQWRKYRDEKREEVPTIVWKVPECKSMSHYLKNH